MTRDWQFEQQVLNDNADQDYREAVAEERAQLWATIERVPCGFCQGQGRVEVRDGTPFPALALCSACNAKGWIIVERGQS